MRIELDEDGFDALDLLGFAVFAPKWVAGVLAVKFISSLFFKTHVERNVTAIFILTSIIPLRRDLAFKEFHDLSSLLLDNGLLLLLPQTDSKLFSLVDHLPLTHLRFQKVLPVGFTFHLRNSFYYNSD